ncbi:MAG: S8 family serine peptidase [Deltaproteobacteria bacterium]|nr:S8 family serine peptidase [Deltaproteobacteria bacterium]
MKRRIGILVLFIVLLASAPAGVSAAQMTVDYGGHRAVAGRILLEMDGLAGVQRFLTAKVGAAANVESIALTDGRLVSLDTAKAGLPDLSHLQVRYISVEFDPAADLDQMIAQAEGWPGVAAAWPDYVHEAFDFSPDDPLYGRFQSNFRQINLPDAWDYTLGEGVIVGVIDTGYYTGELLDPAHLAEGYDFYSNDADPQDFIGHGTLVGNVIGEATDNGIGCAGAAGEATIMPLKVFPDADGGAEDSDIARAIDFAVGHGAQVINMSLGGGDFSGISNNAATDAFNANVLLFAATGNEDLGTISYPAGYDAVIAVGSSRPRVGSNPVVRSPFSNYGEGTELLAPGEEIVQETIGGDGVGYYGAYGTSVSCPHASAVAALLIAGGPEEYDVEDLRDLMQSTANPGTGPDDEIGYGEIDAGAAMAVWGIGDPNEDPKAVINVDKSSGSAPLTVQFSGAFSSDPEGEIVAYRWTLPGGADAETAEVEYTFREQGDFTVTLAVTDAEGAGDATAVTIKVSASHDDDDGGDDSGCGCSTTGSAPSSGPIGVSALVFATILLWRRRR